MKADTLSRSIVDSDLFVICTLGNQFNSLAAGNPVLTREQRFAVKYTYSFLK